MQTELTGINESGLWSAEITSFFFVQSFLQTIDISGAARLHMRKGGGLTHFQMS